MSDRGFCWRTTAASIVAINFGMFVSALLHRSIILASIFGGLFIFNLLIFIGFLADQICSADKE